MGTRIKQWPRLLLAGMLVANISGCLFPGVFRIDIAQGNIFTQDMLKQLSPGMTREQVRYVMGSPIVEDTLNPDRWDYVYSFSHAGKAPTVYHLSIYFDGDNYIRYEGSAPTQADLPQGKLEDPDTSPTEQL